MDRLREELRLEKEKVIHFLFFFAKICLIVLQLLAQKHDSCFDCLSFVYKEYAMW
jgi:hypothetical protein